MQPAVLANELKATEHLPNPGARAAKSEQVRSTQTMRVCAAALNAGKSFFAAFKHGGARRSEIYTKLVELDFLSPLDREQKNR